MRLQLPEVTLCCVDTSERFGWALQALARCVEAIEFGDAVLVSDRAHLAGARLPHGVRAVAIEPLASVAAYSRFMLEGVAPLLQTSHVLVVQWDGFVLHPERWDAAFLRYDYIGAPWRHLGGRHRVGNGGFSLRSLRLLRALPAVPPHFDAPEDAFIARRLRPQLEARGLRFAPVGLAARFSVENGRLSSRPFGFHGPQHFPAVLGVEGTLAYLRGLSPSALLASRHARETTLGLAAAIGREARRQSAAFAPVRLAFDALLQAAIAGQASGGCDADDLDRLCRGLLRTGYLEAAQQIMRGVAAQAGARRVAGLRARLAARRLQHRLAGLAATP
jgi:hypothetical protein